MGFFNPKKKKLNKAANGAPSLCNRAKFINSEDITADALAFWRKRYPDGILDISIDGKVGYFRKLSKPEIERELRVFGAKQSTAATKEAFATDCAMSLIKLSMLGGDTEILNNERFRPTVLKLVGDFVLGTIKDAFPELWAIYKNSGV